VGVAANTELKQQGEKILDIEKGVMQIESNLKKVDKQVRLFVRYLLTKLGVLQVIKSSSS
jgi:hypothetical protein